MNKKEYLRILKQELKDRNIKNIDDIIEDYDDLIYQKMQAGKSEEEAVKDLGPVVALANSYGKSQVVYSEKDAMKFILLQIFNLIVGFAIIFSAIAIMLSFIVVNISLIIFIVVMSFHLLTGAFTTLSTIFIALSFIAGSIFVMSIIGALLKVLYLLIHNYVLYNINTLRTKKFLYKKIRVKKFVLITSAVSFVLAIALGSISVASSDGGWTNNTLGILNKVSYSSYDDIILEENEEIEFDEEIDSIKIDGFNVLVKHGSENKVKFNYEIDYEIDDNELIIKNNIKDKFFDFDFITTKSEYPTLVVTTKNDIINLEVEAIDVEINNIGASEYKIDAINAEFDEENIYDKIGINISIDSIYFNGEFKNFYIEDLEIDAIDLEINFVDSNIEKLDLEGCISVAIDLENTNIKYLYETEFIHDIDMDSKSNIRNRK
ncbi:MAG: DUF1700 domain-containing protein [Bacilli bacterium]